MPPFRRRLHRFIRAKRSHQPPLALQERDLDLLRTAYEYRLITTPQFLLLYSDEGRDAIYRRLQKLFHHGYVDRIGRNPNAPLVYALGSRGGEVLGVSCRKAVGDPYLLHQLMIGNFRVTLALASQSQGVTALWRGIDEELPVRPDGFFGLQFPGLPDGRNRAFFFLETDRSTMTSRRFVPFRHRLIRPIRLSRVRRPVPPSTGRVIVILDTQIVDGWQDRIFVVSSATGDIVGFASSVPVGQGIHYVACASREFEST